MFWQRSGVGESTRRTTVLQAEGGEERPLTGKRILVRCGWGGEDTRRKEVLKAEGGEEEPLQGKGMLERRGWGGEATGRKEGLKAEGGGGRDRQSTRPNSRSICRTGMRDTAGEERY